MYKIANMDYIMVQLWEYEIEIPTLFDFFFFNLFYMLGFGTRSVSTPGIDDHYMSILFPQNHEKKIIFHIDSRPTFILWGAIISTSILSTINTHSYF